MLLPARASVRFVPALVLACACACGPGAAAPGLASPPDVGSVGARRGAPDAAAAIVGEAGARVAESAAGTGGDVAAPPAALPCAQPLAVIEDGVRTGEGCEAELAARGLTPLDLGDDWAPRIFDPDPATPEAPHPYRAVFVALADEREDELPEDVEPERHLELFGIPPTFRVLRARLADEARHACHAAVDDAALAAYEGTLRSSTHERDEEVRDLRALRFLDHSLEAERVRLGLPDVASLEGVTPRGGSFADWRRLHARIDAIRAAQAHLRCEGLLPRSEDGVFDGRLTAALAAYQRLYVIVGGGALDAPTRARLVADSRESAFLAVLRALRERVVDATGLLEDGSAAHAWGTVLDRTLDAPEMHATAGRPPLAAGAPDLVSPATEAAARALGWTSPEAFLASDVRGRVAVRLPPAPDYHAPHMELRAELDRGDLSYDFPYTSEGRPRALRISARPVLTIYARDGARDIPLVRWPTTIGGWKPERTPAGGTALRYKESPVGPRLWRDLVAAPAWLPPASTPDDELVRRRPDGRWVPDHALFGPGYRSAYGLAMVMHLREIVRGGETRFYDEGVRTHGSVSYRSILGGTSHGCHRLYNHLALRLTGFLLAHRTHVRRGSLEVLYTRRIAAPGRTLTLRIPSRGYLYELTPPVRVEVLRGNVIGNATEAFTGFRPLPEVLARQAEAAASADEGM